MLASVPKGMLKTIAFDSGKGFANFAESGQALGAEVCSAAPYRSWERGTNESRSGAVRKVKPKGSSFDDVPDEEVRRVDYMLNDRPLRCLNWRTPASGVRGTLAPTYAKIRSLAAAALFDKPAREGGPRLAQQAWFPG